MDGQVGAEYDLTSYPIFNRDGVLEYLAVKERTLYRVKYSCPPVASDETAPAPQLASARTWTDSTGNHTVEAEFVDLKDGKVRLKKEDGKTITIPIERLSEADQEFVKSTAGSLPEK